MHLFLLTLIFFSYFTPQGFSLAPSFNQQQLHEERKEIRVLLGTFQRTSISGYDLILDGKDQLDGEANLSLKCVFTAKGEAYVSSPKSQTPSAKLEITSPGGFLKFNGNTYRNRITILAKGNQCLVINTLDLEKYLAGLINKEMAPHWPLDALMAQAVASRTYAIYQAEANKIREYDLESTTADQVYFGSSSETVKSNQAVEATRGEVLSFAGSPIKAYFHANCGGKTEAPEFVWGQKNPAFRSVYCPYHRKKSEKIDWQMRLSKMQIFHALKKIGGILPKGFIQVARVEAGAPNENQRLSDLMVSDANGNSVLISANAFRNAVGNTRFRSTSFRIEKSGNEYHFSGEGFGHGVGMCQIGARAMAQEGKTYRQILAHYYPLARIKKLAEVRL